MRPLVEELLSGAQRGERTVKSIIVQVPAQTLELFDGNSLLRRYAVSTSDRGTGEKNGSFCTPRGRHLVRARIGAGAPPNTVFVKRRPTGEMYTTRRYIYIHGSPDSAAMGSPGSIGCIRMHNRDIVELFDLIEPGTPVDILDLRPV